jgi:hypothetical protein
MESLASQTALSTNLSQLAGSELNRPHAGVHVKGWSLGERPAYSDLVFRSHRIAAQEQGNSDGERGTARKVEKSRALQAKRTQSLVS